MKVYRLICCNVWKLVNFLFEQEMKLCFMEISDYFSETLLLLLT